MECGDALIICRLGTVSAAVEQLLYASELSQTRQLHQVRLDREARRTRVQIAQLDLIEHLRGRVGCAARVFPTWRALA